VTASPPLAAAPRASGTARFELLGIGNAIVDVLARCTDEFLAREGLAKGVMTLIDAEAAERLYGRMGPGIEMSGGSAANTLVAFASCGGRGAFIGKVAGDQLGQVFRHDIRAAGVAFDSAPAPDGPPTARCLILVGADAQRTMQTFLGACVLLGPEDVDPRLVADADVTYLEGYLFDPPHAKAAFRAAARTAHEAGRLVALTLSDPFCVHRHRADFRALVKDEIDILFANEHEIMALYEAGDFDEALQAVRAETRIACLTRSEKGSVIVAGEEVHVIDAAPASVVDTTGAGDAYAAGFLFGLARGWPLGRCGRAGAAAAAEAISHFGARPAAPLSSLMARLSDD